MDKIAINHKTALKIGYDSGLINELNIESIYNDMKDKLYQPTSGYFIANDVSVYFENQLKDLIQWSY